MTEQIREQTDRDNAAYYQAERYRPQSVEGKGSVEKNPAIKKPFQFVEKTVLSQIRGSELNSHSAELAGKYTYKAGKYAALAGKTVAGGMVKTAAAMTISKDDYGGSARTALKTKMRQGIKSSGSSVKRILTFEAKNAIKNFHGSDDLGIQAMVKTKDAVVRAKGAAQAANTARKATVKTAKMTYKGTKVVLKTTAKIVKKTTELAIKLVKEAASLIARLVTAAVGNPVALIVIAVIAIVAVLCMFIGSLLPAISLKADDKELMEAYLHVTELDAEYAKMLREKLSDPSRYQDDVDEVDFYYDDRPGSPEVPADDITIYTNADYVLMYLDAKYQDYQFSDVEAEIEDLHAKLHTYTGRRWRELRDGEEVWHMSIYISSIDVAQYLEEEPDVLTAEEQVLFDCMYTVGCYTAKKELGNPFYDSNDGQYTVNSRWGWRWHPIDGQLRMHNGIDIPQPDGTPVNNVLTGTVIDVGYDADGWGNYVRVQNEAATADVVYCHLSSVSVAIDDAVQKGTVIGKVGSTGAATGPHLHLEYTMGKGFFDGDGYKTSAAFYLDGYTGPIEEEQIQD